MKNMRWLNYITKNLFSNNSKEKHKTTKFTKLKPDKPDFSSKKQGDAGPLSVFENILEKI